MPSYSIKDLEIISGIKAHTIRIWEQRYGLLTPKRTDTNIRYYDDVQMCKLLNVSNLLDNGLKVSLIASLTNEELNKKVDDLIQEATSNDTQANMIINQIIKSGLSYDESAFHDAYTLAVQKYGMVNAYLKVIYPMLVRLGLMWNKQDLVPSQEHFISNLIKQKLFSAINEIPEPSASAESWALLLPEEEDHEIGLLLSSFILRSNGKKVYYLGQRVPYSSVESFIESKSPDNLHFFMVKNHSANKAQKIIDQLEEYSKRVSVYISGSECLKDKIKLPANFLWINSIENFMSIL